MSGKQIWKIKLFGLNGKRYVGQRRKHGWESRSGDRSTKHFLASGGEDYLMKNIFCGVGCKEPNMVKVHLIMHPSSGNIYTNLALEEVKIVGLISVWQGSWGRK